jgi:hypothetical protein
MYVVFQIVYATFLASIINLFFHYDHVMSHDNHVMSHDNHVMSHDIHVMPHDASIESRKILKPSKVKEQKKKRRRCHLIKGELLKKRARKRNKRADDEPV